uniref:Glycoside hydrolase family 2 catalytic domain-containing protein n=1 Tax=Noctiluca scintillans TaxID=2966 RepID=A0A7S1ADC9_NOCSC
MRGVAGSAFPAEAKGVGAAVLRTWDYGMWSSAFQNAAQNGLMVSNGIDITQDPYYYTTDENCREDSPYWNGVLQDTLRKVAEYREHASLLWWTVGNELESQVNWAAGNDCLWRRVEWLAARVKAADPAHPVGTVLANIHAEKVGSIARLCPSLDFLGVNVYGNDAYNMGSNLRSMGWFKPHAITEYGVPGWWSVPTTSWGARLETMTSRQKAQFFTRTFNQCLAEPLCVGSWAFLWGWKWEKTGTWFGLFDQWDAAGAKNGPLDILYEIQAGWLPGSPPPPVSILDFTVFNGRLESNVLGFSADRGALVRLDAKVSGDVDEIVWVVAPESDSYVDGNVLENAETAVVGAVQACSSTGGSLVRGVLDTTKLAGASYRVYLFVRSKAGVTSTASAPFLIGQQQCHTAVPGEACYTEIFRIKAEQEARGVCLWPADALLTTSTVQEFQASLHRANWPYSGPCPAPCSPHVPLGLPADCGAVV